MKNKKKPSSRKHRNSSREISDYDQLETRGMIDASKPLKFGALRLNLPNRQSAEAIKKSKKDLRPE